MLNPSKFQLLVLNRVPYIQKYSVLLFGGATHRQLHFHHELRILFVVFFVVAVDRLWIVKEEVNLEAEFGQQYRDYKQRVRRWL